MMKTKTKKIFYKKHLNYTTFGYYGQSSATLVTNKQKVFYITLPDFQIYLT